MNYQNDEFECLKNNQSRFASEELNQAIEFIQNYYKKFNKEYSRYTSNYISTVTNILNNYEIKNSISS